MVALEVPLSVCCTSIQPYFQTLNCQQFVVNMCEVFSAVSRFTALDTNLKTNQQNIKTIFLFISVCPTPSPLLHGHVEYTSTLVGSKATYSCDVGFARDGLTERICLPTAKWDGETPVCVQGKPDTHYYHILPTVKISLPFDSNHLDCFYS